MKIIFSDIDRTVALKDKNGNQLTKLGYDLDDYPDVKDLIQKFMDEPDLQKKLSHLANALNIGSFGTELTEEVFLLQILWGYGWGNWKKESEEKSQT